MSHLNSLDHWIASVFGYLMMYNYHYILKDIRKTTNFPEYCKTAPNHRSLNLRVSHIVVSPHTLLRGDVQFFKWEVLVSIRSSKTKKSGKPTEIPIPYGRDKFSCPVYWLDKLFRRYPRNKNDYLFSTIKVQSVSYSMFNTALKSLTAKAGIKGDFATHSLRRGGTTSLHHKGAPLPYIRERGQWASDCIYKYIKPSTISKIKNDKKFSTTLGN